MGALSRTATPDVLLTIPQAMERLGVLLMELTGIAPTLAATPP